MSNIIKDAVSKVSKGVSNTAKKAGRAIANAFKFKKPKKGT